jgi:hypothetical protein
MDSAAVAARGTRTVDELTQAAQRARASVASGRGPVHGTRVHTSFAEEVQSLGRSDLSPEISYLRGQVVRNRTRESIRADVVEGPLTNPMAIYDLKTGRAKLTPTRIQQIRQHLPGGGVGVPIREIR